MVGSDMLLTIHKRLNEIKGNHSNNVLFGNVSILAVGDLYQLPPVMQSPIFMDVKDAMARLNGSLWNDEFQLHELNEIMRQKDDKTFGEQLCRIRTGQHNKDDIEMLQSRVIKENDPNYPKNALHLYATNYDVRKHNKSKLDSIASKNDQVSIPATDDKTDVTGQLNMDTLSTGRKISDTGGLETMLVVAVGARVMMTINVDTADGLVNGVMGEIVAIKHNNAHKVMTILVKFDHVNVGKSAVASSQWRSDYPGVVPVMRYESRYEKAGRKGAQVSRYQFPLTLAWAVTIHKCQGLTMEEVVMSMKGSSRFNCGQAYVAMSRVKSLNGLYIKDFDKDGIKTDARIVKTMADMRKQLLDIPDAPLMLTMNKPQWLTIGHLNVHYFLEKLPDLLCSAEKSLYDEVDVMCFTETYLTKDHDIQDFLNMYGYESFRLDVPSVSNHRGQHGVMICALTTVKPQDLDVMHVDGLESKVIVIETNKSRMIIATIYKRPSLAVNSFLDLLRALLNLMPPTVPTMIVGDFNMSSSDDSHLVKFMDCSGYKQYVSQPTTDSGSTLDHIYYNRVDDEAMVDIHDVYYSDHDAVFLTVKQENKK